MSPVAAAAAPPARSARPPRPGLLAILAWFGAALAFVELVFFGGASNFLPSPQARILTQLVVGVAAIAWAGAAWRHAGDPARRDVAAGPLLLPGLAWGAVQLLSAATSQRPASSLEAAALLLLAIPGYLVVRAALRHPVLRPRLDWLLVVATLLFLLAYLWQVLDQWLAWWGAVGLSVPPLRPADVGLTVGTANAIAVYAELLVVPAAWIAWRRWHRRWLTGLILLLGAATLLISASRGGWIGTAAGVALVVVSRLLHAGREGDGVQAHGAEAGRASVSAVLAGIRARVRARGRTGAAVAVLGVVVVLAAVAVGGPVLATRLLSSDAGRGELWGAGLQIWLAHPLLGAGPGAWPGLRADTDISIASYAVLYTPHSSLVQVLAETGIAGLIAALVLVAAVSRLAWRAIRSAATRGERVEREIAAAALLALVVHSLVDPMFHIPAVVLLTLLLVARLEVGLEADAAAAGGVEPNAGQGGRAGLLAAPRARIGVALLPVVAGAALLVPIDGAMLDAQRGTDLLDAGRPAEALVAFDRAVAAHDLAPYRVGQGIARASVGDAAGAIQALRAAQRLEPFTFIGAQVAWLQGPTDLAGAAATAREAVQQGGVYDPAANLNLAIVLVRAGAGSEAVALLATVFRDVPELIHSPRPEPISAGLWDDARAIALAQVRLDSPGRAVLEEIRAGLPAAASDLAALPSGPERRLLEQVRAAETGTAPDLPTARADLRADRSNPVAMAAFDRLARLAGSDVDIRLVQAINIALLTDVPPPDREIRFDGSPQDHLVLGLPRWPMASDSRLGPRRPFLPGMATIQVVLR